MKPKNATASTNALPEGHGLVLLPDGRVAKVKQPYDVGGGRLYYNFKLDGEHRRIPLAEVQRILRETGHAI